MAKIAVLLGILALITWRVMRFPRLAARRDREADQMRHPLAGVLFAILVTAVLLLALFVLPGVIDRLP
jgi:hypothetical protein